MKCMKFKNISFFSRSLRKEVEALGWDRLTQVQALAIPIILKEKNVLLIAPTGTGKTEAAILPIFEQFLKKRSKRLILGISILYITPLRALNRDIFKRLIDIGKKLNVNY